MGKLSHFLATNDHEVRASRLGWELRSERTARGTSVDDEVLIGLDVEEGDRGLSAMAGPSTAPRNSVPVSAISILTTAGEAGKNAWDTRLAASADNEPLPTDLRSRSRHQLLGGVFRAAAPRRREAGRPPMIATLSATVNSDMQNKIDKLLSWIIRYCIVHQRSSVPLALPCLALPCLALRGSTISSLAP
ncbi:hypothetical protein CUJ84_pRLN2000542 (plasmid) [Rhizobium leguminosarum]|uniref:Uncharacterized protein n=1 Tax=Rhizobium leguminosarum TaxID=384 RepID=A0A2K9ZFV4_RHILE|nr:hypothetical protein CUJ84_pRLN2000542 [Rhizobium leguminosarum]